MLAHCVQQQWVTDGYHRFMHPMQQRVVSTLARWMRIGAADMDQGIDGCGLPTFALALDSVADGCAKFAAAVADDDPAPAAIFGAMVAHPEYVAGTARLDTDLMRIADPPLFAKVGAEGFYTAGIPSLRIGVALKVDDGNVRASEPALLAVLRAIDAVSEESLHQLSKYATPQIVNTRDEPVGHIRTSLQF
jgi:L-asparaginase II